MQALQGALAARPDGTRWLLVLIAKAKKAERDLASPPDALGPSGEPQPWAGGTCPITPRLAPPPRLPGRGKVGRRRLLPAQRRQRPEACLERVAAPVPGRDVCMPAGRCCVLDWVSGGLGVLQHGLVVLQHGLLGATGRLLPSFGLLHEQVARQGTWRVMRGPVGQKKAILRMRMAGAKGRATAARAGGLTLTRSWGFWAASWQATRSLRPAARRMEWRARRSLTATLRGSHFGMGKSHASPARWLWCSFLCPAGLLAC